MDGLREEMDANFPGYYLDFMEVEADGHCELCPFGLVNGEHASSSSSSASSTDEPKESTQNESVNKQEMEMPKNIQEVHHVEHKKNEDVSVSDDELMPEGGVHPLLFPDVVQDILNHLPAKDVEACRLVCRAWNTEACKVLKNKRLVVFMDADAVRVYNNAMRNTTDFPHAQYEFCIQDFTGIVEESLREFWGLFGPHIKSLEFRQAHLFWRDIFEVFEEKLPLLEKLSLRHLPRNLLRTRTELTPISTIKELHLSSIPSSPAVATERLTDLLKALPNLEVIEFLPIKTGPVKSRVSSVLIDILRNPDVNLPNLRRLNLNLELSNEGLEGLATKQFQFQRLHISLANGVKATSFKDLLCSLRPTLSELKITFPDLFTNYQSFLSQNNLMKPEECVQVLTNLKSLSMANFKGSINFVQKLPKLQQLQFTTSTPDKTIPFGFKRSYGGSSIVGCNKTEDHSLRTLKVVSTSPNFTIAETLTLESISRCFPYLTCLRLHGVDDDGLGVIYRNLPFLSDVEFLKAACTDQGLTGIPLEICNDMVETSTFIVVQAERYRRDLFIGSLQFLRKFSIIAPKISDASIALGLVDCKNLKELTIGSPLITDTGVIFVTDKFHKQLYFLDVSECSEITEQSKFYAGEKLMGTLKVAETPTENQTTTKPAPKELVSNPDRGIVKTRKATTTAYGGTSTSTHSKYHVQDTEFFEDHSDDDLRDRGFPHAAFLPPDQNNRLRILRIREALRRNGDFMRNLLRMGLQQFRRLYGREIQDAAAEEPEDFLEMQRNILRLRRNRQPANVEGDVDVPNVAVEPEDENVVAEGENLVEERPMRVLLEEDDGGPIAGAAGDAGPDRLPEMHLAEINRLGLRLEDVEYMLRNRFLFEREDLANPNADAPLLRHIRAEVLLAGMNLVEEDNNAGIVVAEDEDIDLEAIRRVVLNAFGDDLPFEG